MPRCNHVVFRVADLERSIRFYERVLPGRLVARREGKDRWRSRAAWIEPLGHEGFAIVLICPTRIRRVLAALHALLPRSGRSFEHFGLVCDSEAEVRERYEDAVAAGARPKNAPALVDEKAGFLAEVLDPDGNAIEWTFGQTFG